MKTWQVDELALGCEDQEEEGEQWYFTDKKYLGGHINIESELSINEELLIIYQLDLTWEICESKLFYVFPSLRSLLTGLYVIKVYICRSKSALASHKQQVYIFIELEGYCHFRN